MDMENIAVIERTDTAITLEFVGETETLLNLLKQKLLSYDDVASASYIMGHPLVDQPRLMFTCRKGKPEQHLRKAAKELRAEFDDFETQLMKA